LTINPTAGGTFSYGGVNLPLRPASIIAAAKRHLLRCDTYQRHDSIEGVLTLTGSRHIGTTNTLTISSTGTFNLGGARSPSVPWPIRHDQQWHVECRDHPAASRAAASQDGSDTLVISGSNSYHRRHDRERGQAWP